jgi:hypothetical protein
VRTNNNRGTETQQSTSDFDVNGNLLTLDNIGTLNWYYNNTLGKLKKADSNTTQYYNMVQWLVCRLILDNLLSGAKYSRISPRGGRGSSADIKGIFGFKYRRISSPLFFSFILLILL